jgi:hypothetical protein
LPEAEGDPDIIIRVGRIAHRTGKTSIADETAFNSLAGTFRITNGSEIVVDPLPGADPEAMRVILIGRMLAYLLRQRGWLSLHGSGVSIDGRGVLFLGASGAGKSTTAAAFHSRGHHVATDDVAPVRISDGRCILLPGRSRLRLDESSRAIVKDASAVLQWDKYLVDVGRGTLPESVEVKRIYSLVDGDEIIKQQVPLAPAVRVLSAHSFFRRGKMDLVSLQSHLRDCAAVAGTAAVWQLTRPRSLSALPRLVEFVENDLANG